jgi:hypothetical protein
MRAQLSNHDYEQLSAYIDGQLAPAERRKLEERLRVQAELQAAFDDISRTRALLRSAPRRRAPRNFTLTPAMVGERGARKRGSWWNLFPVLSFTSALATLALVASIVFQLLPGQMAAQTAVRQSQADRVAEIVRQTMTVMQATAPANQNFAAPQAQKAVPTQSGMPVQPTENLPSLAGAAPTATAEIAPAAPAAAGTATAELPAASALADSSQNTPPIITWNGNTNSQNAYGMGGGGGGEGPSLGPLLGPPEAVAPNTIMGKGGGGGDITYGQSGTIVIPAQGLNAQEQPTAETSGETGQPAVEATSEPAATPAPADVAPAPVNPAISGTGPILGVPSQGEGGQIVEKKAILGQVQARTANSGEPVQPQPGADQNPVGENSPAGGQTVLGFPLVAVVQGLLVLIAVGTGMAAFLVRRRAR